MKSVWSLICMRSTAWTLLHSSLSTGDTGTFWKTKPAGQCMLQLEGTKARHWPQKESLCCPPANMLEQQVANVVWPSSTHVLCSPTADVQWAWCAAVFETSYDNMVEWKWDRGMWSWMSQDECFSPLPGGMWVRCGQPLPLTEELKACLLRRSL